MPGIPGRHTDIAERPIEIKCLLWVIWKSISRILRHFCFQTLNQKMKFVLLLIIIHIIFLLQPLIWPRQINKLSLYVSDSLITDNYAFEPYYNWKLYALILLSRHRIIQADNEIAFKLQAYSKLLRFPYQCTHSASRSPGCSQLRPGLCTHRRHSDSFLCIPRMEIL